MSLFDMKETTTAVLPDTSILSGCADPTPHPECQDHTPHPEECQDHTPHPEECSDPTPHPEGSFWNRELTEYSSVKEQLDLLLATKQV